MKRAKVVFSGRVQGVGFRFTTSRIASRFREVTGYVRNMPSGDVELVCEGPGKEIKSFLDDIDQNMYSYIQNKNIVWESPTGEFENFKIRT